MKMWSFASWPIQFLCQLCLSAPSCLAHMQRIRLRFLVIKRKKNCVQCFKWCWFIYKITSMQNCSTFCLFFWSHHRHQFRMHLSRNWNHSCLHFCSFPTQFKIHSSRFTKTALASSEHWEDQVATRTNQFSASQWEYSKYLVAFARWPSAKNIPFILQSILNIMNTNTTK